MLAERAGQAELSLEALAKMVAALAQMGQVSVLVEQRVLEAPLAAAVRLVMLAAVRLVSCCSRCRLDS